MHISGALLSDGRLLRPTIRVRDGRTPRSKAPRVRLIGTVLRGIAREAALKRPGLSGAPGSSFSFIGGRYRTARAAIHSSSLRAVTCDRRCPGQSGWGKSCKDERSSWQSLDPHGRGSAPELTQPGWRALGFAARPSLRGTPRARLRVRWEKRGLRCTQACSRIVSVAEVDGRHVAVLLPAHRGGALGLARTRTRERVSEAWFAAAKPRPRGGPPVQAPSASAVS